MKEQPNNGDIILYQTKNGKSKIGITLSKDNVWLTFSQMEELFQREKSTISRHKNNVFRTSELNADSVVAFITTAASDNEKHQVAYYNLNMITSVGYRTKPHRSVQFWIWAILVLRDFLIKGFVVNDKPLKCANGGNYFNGLLSRIFNRRSSEKDKIQKLHDFLKLSSKELFTYADKITGELIKQKADTKYDNFKEEQNIIFSPVEIHFVENYEKEQKD